MNQPRIIFQSSQWVAVDKPPMWLSVPSRLGRGEIRPVVGSWLEAELKRQIWPVHRLDFEVSGTLLFAANHDAHRASQKWFESRAVEKKYEAWSEGPLDLSIGEEFCWKSRIVRGKKRSFVADHGQPAETLAKFLGVMEGRGQWILQPLTGRGHQLRLEMARHHFSICGDVLYGARAWNFKGIALRARSLDFSNIQADDFARWELPRILEVGDLQSILSPSR